MDEAIKTLKDCISKTANVLKDSPCDQFFLDELSAYVIAINILEIHEYGEGRTKFMDYLPKINKRPSLS